jgi:tetratricopeptide (TPR) repeat protein
VRSLAAALILLLAAVAVPSAAGRPWRMIRGKSVIVVGQQSPKTLRDIAVQIEQFRMALGGLIKGARAPLPIPTLVMTFDDYDALKPFVPLYQGKPASLGGFCHCGAGDEMSVIAASLATYDESSAIIFHEYAHLLIHNSAAGVPLWLNEGLAEYFSTFRLKASGREAVIGSIIPRHVGLLRQRFVPLAQVLSVKHDSPLYNERDRQSIFYAEAWALTHYLLVERPNGNAAINKYLESKDASINAFVAATGVPLTEMEGELRRYVNRPSFMSIDYALPERVDVDAPEQARTLDAADSDARLGELQIRVGRLGEAAARIESAVKAAPELAEPQLALALLRVGQHRAKDSLAPLEKAAALAPDDFMAQYTYALTLLRHASDADMDDETSQRSFERAHEALGKALAANPNSAAALAWRAYADMELDVRWTEARDLTLHAIQLAPGRADYQLQLAVLYLRQMDTRKAGQTLLASLAGSATDDSVAKQARGLLQQLAERERTAGPLIDAPSSSDGPLRPIAVGPPAEQERAHAGTATRDLKLRKVQAGEERALGELVAIDCAPWGVAFRVRVNGRVIVASADKMEDVELTSFLEREFAVACGAHASPERVYLTWKDGGDRNGVVGTAVAVEFLPKTYVP